MDNEQRREYCKKITKLKPGQLADKLGRVKAVSAMSAEREEDLKSEIKRRRRKRFIGIFYEVTVSRGMRKFLNKDMLVAAVTKKLGAPWLKKFYFETPSTTVRCTARKVQLKPQRPEKEAA